MAAAKQKILDALEDLPESSLDTVAEFVDFLRAKALKRPLPTPEKPPPALGGLWKGITISVDDIDEARRNTWSSIGADLE